MVLLLNSYLTLYWSIFCSGSTTVFLKSCEMQIWKKLSNWVVAENLANTEDTASSETDDLQSSRVFKCVWNNIHSLNDAFLKLKTITILNLILPKKSINTFENFAPNQFSNLEILLHFRSGRSRWRQRWRQSNWSTQLNLWYLVYIWF